MAAFWREEDVVQAFVKRRRPVGESTTEVSASLAQGGTIDAWRPRRSAGREALKHEDRVDGTISDRGAQRVAAKAGESELDMVSSVLLPLRPFRPRFSLPTACQRPPRRPPQCAARQMVLCRIESCTHRNDEFFPFPMTFLFLTTTAPSRNAMLDSLATSAHAAKNEACRFIPEPDRSRPRASLEGVGDEGKAGGR